MEHTSVFVAHVGVSLKRLTTNFLTPRERIERFSLHGKRKTFGARCFPAISFQPSHPFFASRRGSLGMHRRAQHARILKRARSIFPPVSSTPLRSEAFYFASRFRARVSTISSPFPLYFNHKYDASEERSHLYIFLLRQYYYTEKKTQPKTSLIQQIYSRNRQSIFQCESNKVDS